MINDKGILIRNIYYMLSYAFQELKRRNYEDIDKEDFERVQDLFAEILYKGMSMQLKQGLYREYIEKHDTLPLLKGKLDIRETIRNRVQRKSVLSCEFDELSENNIFNQIIKTTACILVREKTVSRIRKVQLKSLLPFFDGVDEVNPFTIRWNMLRYQRSNQTYKMLMNICFFVLEGMLMTDESGAYKMATFSDEHMERLFEKFVLEYYRVHHKDLSANTERIDWDIDITQSPMIDFLPAMKTDITLRKGDKTLIIDTKYYGSMMQENFNRQTIHSNNLYQIFTYVKNEDKCNTGNVEGILLYARTQEGIAPDLNAVFGKNRIRVRTLDLNKEFKGITEQLDNILETSFGLKITPNNLCKSQHLKI